MGYWRTDRAGVSFQDDGTGIWGDGPADILGPAVDKIVAEFEEHVGRKPTAGEMRAGLNFTLRGLPDDAPVQFDEDFTGDSDRDGPAIWTEVVIDGDGQTVRPPEGTCLHCKGQYELRPDGTIARHYTGPDGEEYVCPGAGEEPARCRHCQITVTADGGTNRDATGADTCPGKSPDGRHHL
jgi:hypothetical protein